MYLHRSPNLLLPDRTAPTRSDRPTASTTSLPTTATSPFTCAPTRDDRHLPPPPDALGVHLAPAVVVQGDGPPARAAGVPPRAPPGPAPLPLPQSPTLTLSLSPRTRQPTRLEFSSLRPFEPTTLASLPDLLHAIPAPVYASKLSAKLVPLSNPPRPSAAAATKAKAKARREADGVRRKTVGLLSRAEGKRQSVWAPKAGEVRHAQLAPLADLWLAYVRELLGLADQTASLRLDGNNLVEGNIDALLGKLAKAEFVGATLTGAASSLSLARGIDRH